VLRPYQSPPRRSGEVVIREGHAVSSSAPPCVKKEVKEEMSALDEDERP
jgi:hypothetical protein